METELQAFLHSIDGIHGITRPSISEEINMGEYDVYEEMVRKYKPESVLEVGVLFGFSAIAMLWGGKDCIEKYTGFDIELFTKGSNEMAGKNIDLLYKRISIKCPRENIQFLREPHTFPSGNFDLVHIDGDHSFKGCYSDMQKFYPLASKYVVIHDYFYNGCPDVRRAVEKFQEDIGGFGQVEQHPNKRGLILIKK
jgi:cephalosporin hydroxylase